MAKVVDTTVQMLSGDIGATNARLIRVKLGGSHSNIVLGKIGVLEILCQFFNLQHTHTTAWMNDYERKFDSNETLKALQAGQSISGISSRGSVLAPLVKYLPKQHWRLSLRAT